MGLTIDPETGQPTTSGILAARDEDRRKAAAIAALDRALHDDAAKWRSLQDVRAAAERVRRYFVEDNRLKAIYGLGDRDSWRLLMADVRAVCEAVMD